MGELSREMSLRLMRQFRVNELCKIKHMISRKQSFRPCFLEAFNDQEGKLTKLSLNELIDRKKELISEIEDIDKKLREM